HRHRADDDVRPLAPEAGHAHVPLACRATQGARARLRAGGRHAGAPARRLLGRHAHGMDAALGEKGRPWAGSWCLPAPNAGLGVCQNRLASTVAPCAVMPDLPEEPEAAEAEAPSPAATPEPSSEAPTRKRPKPGERRVQILQTLAAMLEQPGSERI